MIYKLPTPAAIVDVDIAKANILSLVSQCEKYNIAHRPHFKTHKSIYLAKLQESCGAKGFTTAKLGEAEVLVKYGFEDILICYPIIGIDKLERLYMLFKEAKVRTVVNSYVGAKAMSDYFVLKNQIMEVLIDVDGGMRRGGVTPNEGALNLAKEIEGLKGIKIVGIAYYDGSIYGCSTDYEILQSVKLEAREMLSTQKLLRENGFVVDILSGGSSFSAKLPEHLEGITEVRAGNYIFNDLAKLSKGIIGTADCSLRVVVTVVSKVDDNNFIIDAGTKTLSSDTVKGRSGYGLVLEHIDAEIFSMNEEHGYVRFNEKNSVKIGDKLTIIPNHACQIPNLFSHLYAVSNGEVVDIFYTEARGKNT